MNEPEINIAETLARVLPKAEPLVLAPTALSGETVAHVALPDGVKVEKIDLENLLPNPRRTKANAAFGDAQSFIDYVKRHTLPGTLAWSRFDPQSFKLDFAAVIDEHAKALAGWRDHKATFAPDMSHEWKAWKGKDRTPFSQVGFAEWVEEHADDITTANGLPTSLQMLQMATEFVAQEEHVLKSAVRLNSGGVRLTYIADPDKGTTEEMKMFEKFAIGIPVFQGGTAWSITARLKYRLNSGKVTFFYELVRPDRVHEGAAKELIQQIRDAIGVPLLMGACV